MRLNKIPKAPESSRPAVKKPEGKDDLWSEVKNKVDDGLDTRRPFECFWILNLAFLHGRQNVFFNSAAHMLQQVLPTKNKYKVVDNQLFPKWRRQVNDLIRARPSMSVVPNSDEDSDIQAANAGDKFLKHFWRNGKMAKKTRKLAAWVHSCGSGFLVDSWNKKLGPEAVEEGSGKIVYQGDADVSVWSPFEILVPSAAQDDCDDGDWIIKRRWHTLGWISAYAKRGSEVPAEDRLTHTFEHVYLLDQVGGVGSGKEEGAFVVDLYMKPCKKYPKGKFISAANGVILSSRDYPHLYYPIEQFKDIEMPGLFWGVATMGFGIILQKIWNDTLSDVYEYNSTMARGKWLAPRNCHMGEGPDSSHGEVVEYDVVLGRKPEHLTLKGLTATYNDILGIIAKSLNDLFSQHEVSQGTNKSDLRSGSMVGLLLEQDAMGGIGTHAIHEESLEATMTRVLRRVQGGYTAQRMIKIRGQEGDFEVLAFQGADLKDNTDVHIVKQSTISESRVAKEQQVLAKYEAGLYGDPANPEVRRHVMKMLEDAVVKDIYSDDILDESYARWENKIIAAEEQVIHLVNMYDNHSIHIKEHTHYRKSLEYQKEKLDPEKQQEWTAKDLRFTEHEKLHQEFLQDQINAQLERQATMEGKGRK